MLRTALDAAVRYSPAQPISALLARRRLTVLAYHGIDDVEQFDWQLGYLRRHSTVVDLSGALAILNGGVEPPNRPVLITFDDGERSLVERGLAVMELHGLPGVAFIVSGLLNTSRPYWWVETEALVRAGATSERYPGVEPSVLVRELKRVGNGDRLEVLEALRIGQQPVETPQLTSEDLRRLDDAGIEIGNHSVTHPCLDMCEPDQISVEVNDAQAQLRSAVGYEPRALAYPNGNHDAVVRRVVGEAGIQAAFTFDHRLSMAPAEDLLAVSRVRVASHTSRDRFATIVSGLHPALHHLLGRP